MKRQTFLKGTLCLLLAMLCNVAWAQTNTDGPIVTFTNVQKGGTTFTLYINDSNQLAASTDDAATLGAKAQFRATLQSNGKYTFYNEEKSLYMIWRNKNAGDGFDGGDGVMATYNSTYCDWTLGTERNRTYSGKDEVLYYITGKRKNGTSDGTLILHKDNYFETWSSGIAWHDNYSNLFRVNIVGSVQYTLKDAQSEQQYTGETTSFYPVAVVAGGVTLSNKKWSNGHFTADFTYNIPVSDNESTNQVIISTYNIYNDKYFVNADGKLKSNRNTTVPFPTTPDNVDVKNYLWAFYPEFVDGVFMFKVKNIGTGKYLQSNSTTTNHAEGEVSLVEDVNAATLFELTSLNQLINSEGLRLSVSSSGGGVKTVGTYHTNHEGTKNKIVNAQSYTLTLADGSTFVGTNGVHNLMGGSYTYTNGTWSDNGYSAAVNVDFTSLPFPVSSAEKVNPTMISSFNEGAGGYGPGRFKWYAAKDDDGDDDVKIKRDALVTEDLIEAYSWAIYPSMENGAFAYSIKNVALGKYIQTTKNFGATAGDNNEGTIILSDTPTKFSVDSNNSLYFFANERNQYLSLGSSGTTEGFLGLHTKTYADGHKGITNAFLTPRYALASKDELKSGAIYTFLTARGWVGATDSDNVIATANTTVNPAASTENEMFQWALYQSKNGNYYLYNLGKKMFMGDVDQSVNEGDIPFAASPMNRNMAFKDNAQAANFPIMFSTNNIHAVSQNTAKGLFAWKGGWNNNDEGSNHQVSYIGELDAEQLKTIADLVEAYDKSMPMKVEVEGSWADNPNTHFGNLTVTTGSAVTTTKLTLENMEVSYVEYTGAGDIFNFTREYRGFEFQGFFLGGENLGKSFTLTEEQEANITEQNPLVAKFKATDAVTLFYDDDPFSYRIPAIGKTSTGRLIAVSDYRYSLDDIGRYNFGTANPGIDLVIRMSDDNGKTWGETKTIAKGSCVRGTDDCAYGDAAIAVVGQKVLVMGAAGDVMFGNGSATAHNRTVRILSEDNGETWTKPLDISETFFINADATINSAYSLFFGSGKLAVDENYNNTGNARIYGAVLVKKNGIGNGIYVVYTDDFGLTWSILGGSQTHITANDEPKVEILPSGQILLSVRRGGGRQFNVFTYTDKATNAGSWNSNVDGCSNGGSNTCNGEIFLVDAKKADGSVVKLLLQSQPKGGGGLYDRRDVTIWYKEVDNTNYTSSQIAGNWIEGMQVSTQQSAYSTMSLQEDGKIAFFFEEAPCYGDDQAKGYCMVYMPLTIENITKGNYFSEEADLTVVQTINVVLTDAQGNEYRDQVQSGLSGVVDAITAKYAFITLGNQAGFSFENGSYTYTNSVTLPLKVSNAETIVWHNIYWPSNTGAAYPIYLSASASGDTYVGKVTEQQAYGNSSSNTAANAAKIGWAVYNVDNGFTFKFKNQLIGKFIQVSSVADGDNQNVKYVAEAEATAFELVPDAASYNGDYALKAVVNSAEGYLCSSSASYGYATHHSSKSHQGAWVKFVEAPNYEELIASITEPLASGMYGDGLGQYKPTGDTDLEAIRTAMESSSSVKLNTLNSYKDLLDAATLNMPQSGQFFRVAYDYGNAGKLYMQSTASTVKGLQFAAETGAASIWVYYEGALYSYAAGQCLREYNDDRGLQAVGGKTTATFSASTRAKGKYNIVCGSYVHANSSNGSYYTDHCSGNDHEAHDLILEEVDALPITIAAIGYGTLYTPVALSLPEGVKAYAGTLNDAQDELTLTEVEAIPANTGVVLYRAEGSEETNHEFEITTGVAPVTSHFVGSVATTAKSGNPFTLQPHESITGVAFKLFTGSNINGFKAYLNLTKTNTAEARAVRISFAGEGDLETGIESVAGGQQPVAIYDLQGRRVMNPTKGMYIIDGKKVIF